MRGIHFGRGRQAGLWGQGHIFEQSDRYNETINSLLNPSFNNIQSMQMHYSDLVGLILQTLDVIEYMFFH